MLCRHLRVSAFGIGSMVIICNSKGAFFGEKVSEEKLPYYIVIVEESD